MFCTDIQAPLYFIFSNSVPHLLYYSHIPTAIVALFFGFFVFYKSRSLASKLLLSLAIVFFIWVFFNLIVWTNVDSRLIMFIWSLFGILDPLLFALGFYFTYVFVYKKDLDLNIKLLLSLTILPAIIFCSKNTIGIFDIPNCEPKQGGIYDSYIFGLEIFFTLLTIIFSFLGYRKAGKDEKKPALYASFGMLFFFLSFFTTGFLASFLDKQGIEYAFQIEQYGLFGMTIFMGFLAYLIVKFKAFNIKMIATQALVAAMIILIASQYAYIQNFTNKILTAITLVLSVIGGYVLVKSVQLEVQRKEQLQDMTDKLAQANDQLRKLDNAKSEFISIASHQLRTPLTAIKGFVSLMLEGSYGEVPEKQREVLSKVNMSNERLITLVEDLLNLSRIESGRMEFNFNPVDMKKVCQEIYDTFAIRAKEKGLGLELKMPEENLREVVTDRNKIREIISNLVDNALKYTPKGGVVIKLTEDDQRMRVAVTDTGIGVPKNEIPYLFAKFSRGKDINRLNTGGTGLGLHVGKRMMEELKGMIWVESEGEGKGSTFFVEVPVKHEEV